MSTCRRPFLGPCSANIRAAPRIGEKAEVGDELVLRAYLQVVARLGLPVVHRVFLHPHESGVGIGLAAGVAPVHRLEAAVVLRELIRHLLKLPHLFLPLARGCLTALKNYLTKKRVCLF